MSLMGIRGMAITAALVVALVVAACGSPQEAASKGTGSAQEPSKDEHDGRGELEAPPPVTIRYFDHSIDLEAWTYCYGTGCADGMPPENPPDVGSPEEVIVEYPLEGWSFTASFARAGEKCGREFPAKLEPAGKGRFLLRPAGYADTYDVSLFGKGGGDLFTTFRWTTPTDGVLPEPEARLAVLADHDGKLDSYGVELMLSHLGPVPHDASATVTVRATNGDEVTFEAKQAGGGCWGEGTIYWDGPDAEGKAAAKLPGERFRYEVEVRLGGQRHVASATWPDDVIPGNEPSVALHFDPALPALK